VKTLLSEQTDVPDGYTPAHKQHDIASSKPLGSAVTPKFRRFRSADEGALFWVFPLIS
jgi:hypothetical protein